MKQALEALEKVITAFGPGLTLQQKAATALRQALVDADDTSQERVDEIVKDEQEPVAWFSTAPDGKLSNKFACKPTEGNWVEPLYTAPPKREWVGLTGDEARKFYEKYTDREELIHAIDKFLEEKNGG
jgi:hypothetical protein